MRTYSEFKVGETVFYVRNGDVRRGRISEVIATFTTYGTFVDYSIAGEPCLSFGDAPETPAPFTRKDTRLAALFGGSDSEYDNERTGYFLFRTQTEAAEWADDIKDAAAGRLADQEMTWWVNGYKHNAQRDNLIQTEYDVDDTVPYATYGDKTIKGKIVSIKKSIRLGTTVEEYTVQSCAPMQGCVARKKMRARDFFLPMPAEPVADYMARRMADAKDDKANAWVKKEDRDEPAQLALF